MYQCVTLWTVQNCIHISASHYRQCRVVYVSVCHNIDSTGVYTYQFVTSETVQVCVRVSVTL